MGKVDHGVFGKKDAAEFRADALALQEVNEVYKQAHLDEAELPSWPKEGSVPQALAECCIAVPMEDGVDGSPRH